MFYDGTSPTLTLVFDEETDFSDVEDIVVTLTTDYRKVLLEKNMEDLVVLGNTIAFELTQEDTFSFGAETGVLVQANFLFSDGSRACSEIIKTQWHRNLKREVMR